MSPSSGVRGKCGEHKPNYNTAAVPIDWLAYTLNFIGTAAYLYMNRDNLFPHIL